ncbi:hypothetical protein GCM10009575_029360 [Streptomyces rhizosphaericus]|uniref:Ig-like domain-containing protein n=1 Tax=Streptomyces rhizosphaericus TaxID=114699 RepID=A0ABP3ZZ13_9ACTN
MTARIRLTNRTASSECPPSAKKSSSTATRGTSSTWANTEHKISSYTVAGRLPGPVPDAWCGAGSAARSTLPFTVSGSRSSTTTDGTMYCGSRLAVKSRATAPNPASASPWVRTT